MHSLIALIASLHIVDASPIIWGMPSTGSSVLSSITTSEKYGRRYYSRNVRAPIGNTQVDACSTAGRYMYCHSQQDRALVVLDTSDRYFALIIHQDDILDDSTPYHTATSANGSRLVVMSKSTQIFDISSPAHPSILQTLTISGTSLSCGDIMCGVVGQDSEVVFFNTTETVNVTAGYAGKVLAVAVGENGTYAVVRDDGKGMLCNSSINGTEVSCAQLAVPSGASGQSYNIVRANNTWGVTYCSGAFSVCGVDIIEGGEVHTIYSVQTASPITAGGIWFSEGSYYVYIYTRLIALDRDQYKRVTPTYTLTYLQHYFCDTVLLSEEQPSHFMETVVLTSVIGGVVVLMVIAMGVVSWSQWKAEKKRANSTASMTAVEEEQRGETQPIVRNVLKPEEGV